MSFVVAALMFSHLPQLRKEPPLTLWAFSRYIDTTRFIGGESRISDALRSALQLRYNQNLPLMSLIERRHTDALPRSCFWI